MEDRTVRNERRRAGRDIPTKLDDLLYDAFYSAAIGGSVLGLFFLLIDVVAGQPFYTPSLMGSVLFLGMTPEAVTDIRLDLVAYVTMLHMGAFGALGPARLQYVSFTVEYGDNISWFWIDTSRRYFLRTCGKVLNIFAMYPQNIPFRALFLIHDQPLAP